jgi:hypothetical protein
MFRGTVAAAVSTILLASLTAGEDWRAPAPVASLKAFESAFPKAPASGAALELEALTARLGIDLAPKDERRHHPKPKAAKDYQAVAPAIRQYVDGQLQEAGESVDPPGEAVQQFLSEHEATLDAIVAVAVGRRGISWETDVTAGFYAPTPNVLGQVRLHLVLAARALDEVRSQDPNAALQTIQGMWALVQSLASRPEMVSQILVQSAARLVAGLLRKVDGPAPDWVDRLRDRGFFQSFLAALQNDAWHLAGDAEILEAIQGMTRVNRRFVANLAARDPCGWTREDLDQSWKAAVSGEPRDIESMATMGSENSLDSLNRWHRYLLDAELTALVLEARGEKAASRDGAWPARLSNPESSVCPGSFWRYTRNPSGDVAFAFEGRAPAADRGLILPLTFRSAPPPTSRSGPQ